MIDCISSNGMKSRVESRGLRAT